MLNKLIFVSSQARYIKIFLIFILIVITVQLSSNFLNTTHTDIVYVAKPKANISKQKSVSHQPFKRDSKSFKIQANLFRDDDYLNKISTDRLNKLFNILKEKEAIYGDILKSFDLVSFSDLINENKINSEFEDYIQLKDNNVVATEYLINYLKTKSHIQTERNNMNRDISTHHELEKVFIFKTMVLIQFT